MQPALSLSQRDDCKTRKDTKYCITKQGPSTAHRLQQIKHNKTQKTMGALTNNESTKQNHHYKHFHFTLTCIFEP